MMPLSWDPRLSQRGAMHIPYMPMPGATYYRLVRAEWLDESQGKPTILIDVIDEQGRRLVGVPARCTNGGETIRFTEAKPNDRWATDFPMFNVGPAYRVEVLPASDRVSGLGLGSLADPYHAHHSGYYLVFQRTTFDGVSIPDPPTPPLPPTLDPILDALAQARHAIDTATQLYSRQTGG